jgi:hypothetical protein
MGETFRFLFFLVCFTLTPVITSAAKKTLTMDWNCPQSSSSPLPSHGTLEFGTVNKDGSIDLSLLKKSMDKVAKKSSDTDFAMCYFLNYYNWSSKHQSSDSPKTDTKFFELFGKYNATVSPQAKPPLIPGFEGKPNVSEAEKEKAIAAFKSIGYVNHNYDDIFYSADFMKNELPSIIRSMNEKNPTLGHQALDSYLEGLYQFDRINKPVSQDAVEKTTKLIRDAFPEMNESLPDGCGCQLRNNSFENLVNGWKTAEQCAPVLPGQSVYFNGNLYFKNAAHTVENESAPLKPPKYTLTMNFEFVKADGNEVEELNETWHKKFSECMAKVNPHLKGPGGAQLTIKLADVNDFQLPPDEIKISDVERGHAQNWNRNSDCPTIIHETLHHLGLKDGYKEQNRPKTEIGQDGLEHMTSEEGLPPLYDCRVLEPRDSMMTDPWEAWKEVVEPQKLYDMCACGMHPEMQKFDNEMTKKYSSPETATMGGCPQCVFQQLNPEEQKELVALIKKEQVFRENCKEALNHMNPSNGVCPKGSESEVAMAFTDEEIKNLGHDGYHVVLSSYEEPKIKESLLYPAQFNTILNPGCEAKTRSYIVCSEDAYNTSPENQKGQGSGQACHSKDLPECAGSDWLTK